LCASFFGDPDADGSLEMNELQFVKNYPAEHQVSSILAGLVTKICWTELPYCWFLTYRLGQ
jgi:hypothetical protein